MRARCCWSRARQRRCTPTSSRSPTRIPTCSTSCWPGGVFNAVLVPQLVRRDEGRRRRRRRLRQPRRSPSSALFLGVVTILLVVAAPLADAALPRQSLPRPRPGRPARLDRSPSTRYCLPQVFFYGMFVLVGQVLNARGRFGPMMWAPIANNLIVGPVLVAYLSSSARPATAEHGPTRSPPSQELCSASARRWASSSSSWSCVPYLRAAGFTYRPRFDFRDPGLGAHAAAGRLDRAVRGRQPGRLPRRGPARRRAARSTAATAPATPSTPAACPDHDGAARHRHGLAGDRDPAAALVATPTDGRLPELGRTLGSTLRTALALVLPFALLLPIIGGRRRRRRLRLGQRRTTRPPSPRRWRSSDPRWSFFTVHYFMLRGFYAMEMTRLVFFIQLRGRRRPTSSSPSCWCPRPAAGGHRAHARRRLPGVVRRRRGRQLRPPPPHGSAAWRPRAAPVPGADGPRAGRSPALAAWGVERALAGMGEYPGPFSSLLRGGLERGWPGSLVFLGVARAAAGPRGHQPGRHRRGAASGAA